MPKLMQSVESTVGIKMNEYLTEMFFLLCDDLEREHGNESKAQKIADICAEKGWVTISMANDWTTIYGENVTINPQ